MKPLRPWQQDAVNQILFDVNKGKKHFFCLAATGTGKTYMSAEASKRLLEEDLVDIVIAFCPSNEIQVGISRTFSNHLDTPFDGSLKSKGSVHTYQGMLTLSEDFWELFKRYRVMAVFDEIHHCAGSTFSKKNAWGGQILDFVMQRASFMLCLSGTPWRSDSLPITGANYNDQGELICDFTYGLADAVNDGICRQPSMVLIDNSEISVNLPNEVKKFEGLAQALRHSPLDYLTVLRDAKTQHYLLQQAINKLNDLREINPEAGGIIVASSVDHAETIAQTLRKTFGEFAEVVSYLHPNATETIDTFRKSNQPWLVSVGMISEGTDIPRLQVCCHLSHIRTEMHFRQTLGRILRKTEAVNQEAWFYTFAEPNLCMFAQRLKVDVPSTFVDFEDMRKEPPVVVDQAAQPAGELSTEESAKTNALGFDLNPSTEWVEGVISGLPMPEPTLPPTEQEAEILQFELDENQFVQQLIGLYDHY